MKRKYIFINIECLYKFNIFDLFSFHFDSTNFKRDKILGSYRMLLLKLLNKAIKGSEIVIIGCNFYDYNFRDFKNIKFSNNIIKNYKDKIANQVIHLLGNSERNGDIIENFCIIDDNSEGKFNVFNSSNLIKPKQYHNKLRNEVNVLSLELFPIIRLFFKDTEKYRKMLEF